MAKEERDRLTAEELAIVLSHYDLGVVQEVREFARGSHRAAKLIVRTERGRYLLKRRPAGKTEPQRVAFAHELQAYLLQKHFPLPHLIGTKVGGHSMVRLGETVCEVFEYVEGGPYDQGLLATYEAGKMLGLYHRLMSEYQARWKPPGGHYHRAAVVISYLRELPERLGQSSGVRGRAEEAQRLCERLSEAYDREADEAERVGLLTWAPQIVHSDWHPGNMLFKDGHVVAVIDYDAARIQPRVMDAANGVLQFSLVTGSRDPETWPDNVDEPRAKRFVRGYDEINVLSAAELRCVPPLMAEAFIAEAVIPIRASGTFASIDGFRFLKMVERKVTWIAKAGGKMFTDLQA